jgi:uncharacterized protein HemY
VLQCSVFLGDWETAAPLASSLLVADGDHVTLWVAAEASLMAAARGDEELLGRCQATAARVQDAEDMETRGSVVLVQARAALERDDPRTAGSLVEALVGVEEVSGEIRTGLLTIAVEAALQLGDRTREDKLLTLLTNLAPVHVTPVRLALRCRLWAEQAHHQGDQEAGQTHEREALEHLRAVDARPQLVGALLDVHRRHGEVGAVVEARALCHQLGAARWLERIDARSSVTA